MKILLCNDSYPKAVDRLQSLLPEHQILSCAPTAVLENIDGVEIVIPSVAKITAEIIEKGTFGFIQQLGVGLDPVDIEAATENNVYVARVPGAGSGNAESVAELAIMFMLTLSKRLYACRDNIAKGVFFRPSGLSLLRKKVCIVGLGDIGTAIAERLKPFGVTMSGVRRRKELGAKGYLGIRQVYGIDELDKAFEDADFIILAMPENQDSKNLIDKKIFAQMKRGAYLINVGRGGVIDTDAMLEALQSGQIAGAGLDVFWEEPADPNHPIFKENVVATPHIGGNSDASFDGISTSIAENVKRYASGAEPLHIVNAPSNPRGKR